MTKQTFNSANPANLDDVLSHKIEELKNKLEDMNWGGTTEAFSNGVSKRAEEFNWSSDTAKLVLIDTLSFYIKLKEENPGWGEAELVIELTLTHNKATKDHLTGIHNRVIFDEVLYGNTLYPCSLIILDLNGFKNINDQLGHKAGDEALKHFTKTIQSVTRGIDGFYRLGGDEFGFILPGQDETASEKVITRIREALKDNPFPWNGHEIPLYTSAGIASVERGKERNLSYEEADKKMYNDKRVQPKTVIPASAAGVASGAVFAPQML